MRASSNREIHHLPWELHEHVTDIENRDGDVEFISFETEVFLEGAKSCLSIHDEIC